MSPKCVPTMNAISSDYRSYDPGMKLFLQCVGLLVLITATYANGSDQCSRTDRMQIYSNAYVHPETGDILGYELAVSRDSGSKVDAFFYTYEGAPNDEAIPLSGHLSGKHLTVQGTWVEHLVEHPAKKQIIHTHVITIDGALDPAFFRGHITIEGMVERDRVRLRRVKKIWLCKN